MRNAFIPIRLRHDPQARIAWVSARGPAACALRGAGRSTACRDGLPGTARAAGCCCASRAPRRNGPRQLGPAARREPKGLDYRPPRGENAADGPRSRAPFRPETRRRRAHPAPALWSLRLGVRRSTKFLTKLATKDRLRALPLALHLPQFEVVPWSARVAARSCAKQERLHECGRDGARPSSCLINRRLMLAREGGTPLPPLSEQGLQGVTQANK